MKGSCTPRVARSTWSRTLPNIRRTSKPGVIMLLQQGFRVRAVLVLAILRQRPSSRRVGDQDVSSRLDPRQATRDGARDACAERHAIAEGVVAAGVEDDEFQSGHAGELVEYRVEGN